MQTQAELDVRTQKLIDKTVSQTSEWQTCFRETRGNRITFFIFALLCLVGGLMFLYLGFTANATIVERVWSAVLGIASLIAAPIMYRNSLPHEFHLNFHYRQYDNVFGFGPLTRNETGSFDEIFWVYVRQDVYTDPKSGVRNISYALGFAFGDPSQFNGMIPYRKPSYDVLSVVHNREYLEQYAQTLATKTGRPYTRVNW